jgi:hypothetical protein
MRSPSVDRRPVRCIVAAVSAALCIFGTTSCSRSAVSTAVVNEQVILVPLLRAGSVGWCAMERGTGNCGEGTGHLPILVESLNESSGIGGSGIERGATIEGMVVATPRVAVVALEKFIIMRDPLRMAGRERWSAAGTFALHKEPGLPDGLHAAVLAVKYKRPAGGRILVRFLPLNANGKQISQARARVLLSKMLPVRSVSDAARPASGVCRIDMKPMSGVFAFGAQVINSVMPEPGFIGHAFITCASTIYKIGGWRVEAAVLLDAADPGARPVPLPLMKPLPGRRGVFEAWRESDVPVLARRVPHAWLVVTEGRDMSERLRVLEHLSASMHLAS